MTSLAEDLLDRAVEAGALPAAQLCAVQGGEIAHLSSHGADHLGRPLSEESLFDVASVTKVAATTAAAAVMVSRGALELEAELSRYLPQSEGGPGAATIAELLAHTSGLPAWEPLFLAAFEDPIASAIYPEFSGDRGAGFARSRELVVGQVLAAPLTSRRGARVYSDLGFIALGLALEAIAGVGLDELCRELLYAPLGLTEEEIGYRPLLRRDYGAERQAIPTGDTRPREPAPGQEALYRVHPQPRRVDPGEVDDDNAYALGGVAGHAGLFSTAGALARVGWALLEELEGPGPLGLRDALRRFALPSPSREGSARGLGFDFAAQEGSAAGELIGKGGPLGALGHLGFTGCSLWLDRDRRLSVALLTNRTLEGRERVEGIRALRPAVHDALVAELDHR